MMRNLYPLAFTVSLVAPVEAAIELTDGLMFSGFGSTSVTRSNNDAPLFINREISNTTCYDCDTTFGLQLDYRYLDQLMLSAQVVKRPQDEWSQPELEWLYASYEADALSIAVGRQRLPLFLASEYYFVGHAYFWARPPQDVYDSIMGFTSYDGISFDWQTMLSDALSIAVTPFYGVGKDNPIKYGDSTLNLKSDYNVGLSVELTGINYRLHAAYMNAGYQIDTEPKQTLNMFTLGGEYSMDQWQFIAELENDKMQTAWDLSVAYHYNDWTPYVTYGESHQRRKVNNVILGLRHYFTPHISLNAEWQTTRMAEDDYQNRHDGHFAFPPLYLAADKDAQLYTLMVNFVF